MDAQNTPQKGRAMSAASPAQVADMSAVAAAQNRRVEELRRAYQRRLRRRPTVLQRTIMINACVLTARAEIIAADPRCPINDYVRACRVASEARAAVEAMLAQAEPEEPTLDEMLAGAIE
jgi:hypothetical protein